MLVGGWIIAVAAGIFLCALVRGRYATPKPEETDTPEERFRLYCRKLPGIVPAPVFVKVGANDGITTDPCSDILLSDSNWSGLLIEPVPYCFDRLRANFHDSRRFRVEQIAIGAASGQASFYYVDEKARQEIHDLPGWFDQLGSFNRNHILKHLNGILEPFIIECRIRVHPLSEVLLRNRIQDVHLLHVDTEGHDYEVLKTVDFARHAPLLIYVEHKHLSDSEKSEMLQLLRRHGYSVSDCGADYFAVDEKAIRRLEWRARTRRILTIRGWGLGILSVKRNCGEDYGVLF
jgi:FkbM family methyltransferase